MMTRAFVTTGLLRGAILAVVGCCVVWPVPAAAQLAEPIPQRRDPLSRPMKPPAQREAMLPCPQYGPGFMRHPGSSTCVRVSGQVRGEVGIGGRRSHLDDAVNFSSRARITIDTRTPTEIGDVRLVFRGQGQSSNGWRLP